MKKFSPLRLTEKHFEKENIPKRYRWLSLGSNVFFAQNTSVGLSNFSIRLYCFYCWFFFPICIYLFLLLNLIPEALWQQIYSSDSLFMRLGRAFYYVHYVHSIEGQKLYPEVSYSGYFLRPLMFLLIHCLLLICIVLPAWLCLYHKRDVGFVAIHSKYKNSFLKDMIENGTLNSKRHQVFFCTFLVFHIALLFSFNSDSTHMIGVLSRPRYNTYDVIVRCVFMSTFFYLITVVGTAAHVATKINLRGCQNG